MTLHRHRPISFTVATIAAFAALAGAAKAQTPAPAAAPPVAFTSTRAVFTMAEPVEFSVMPPAGAKNVQLKLQHTDGSITLVPVSTPKNGGVQIVDIVPGALKNGDYMVSLTGTGVDDTVPGIKLTIARPENPNAYWIGAWNQGNPDAATLKTTSGWMYYSSDLLNASVRVPKPNDVMDQALAARIPAFSECVMGGGHQMDLKLTNDWGDSWVQRSVLWKMSLAALSNRLYPQMGIHAFDEPGLTWWPYPDNKPLNPFAIPAEVYEFKHVTGKDMPLMGLDESAFALYEKDPETFKDFVQYRLKFLNQAWTGSKWAVDIVNPKFTTINQLASAYAAGDVADGVDAQMDQAYSVCSGHGGYSDWAGSFGAVLSGETSHGWAWNKPHIYLPMWIVADSTRMRQEAFLPWSIKEEGIMYDPNHNWGLDGGFADVSALLEEAETNRRMAMVGDTLTKLPRNLFPVAVLQSSRQYAQDILDANSPTLQVSAPYQSQHTAKVKFTADRIMATGRMPNWLDESEATAKGAPFLSQWKVIYCPGLSTATPALTKAITGFIAAGGKFVQNADDKLQIPGAVVEHYSFSTDGDPGHDAKGALVNDYYWRQWQDQSAPTFGDDLAKMLGPEPYRSNAADNAMLMTVHKAGAATYLLMGNDSQDPGATRNEQNDPVSLDTTINVPATGPIYDLLNGGIVTVTKGAAPLHLGPGDGACWLPLPADPGKPVLAAKATGGNLAIDIAWGTAGYLPFKLTIIDPAGNKVDQLYRSTTPGAAHTTFHMDYPLGVNAAPGTWTVRMDEWMNGTSTSASAPLKPVPSARLAVLSQSPVSIYMEDAAKITALFAGNALIPPYDVMSFDLKRVMNLDPTKFAVFGPADAAGKIAAALQAKGMTCDVNPDYKIEPFVQEANHGGTGPVQDNGAANFENIYAHAIVLPGSDLLNQSWSRGHINRAVTASFPGPGRAYIQWGIGGYQAGYEDVWAEGDITAATNWILAAIAGKAPVSEPASAVNVATAPATAAAPAYAKTLTVAQQVKLPDSPVGVAVSPDLKTTYAMLLGGEVYAYDTTGKVLWTVSPEIEGGAMALNPKGDRLAVGGFPGLAVLDTATGKTVGQVNAPAPPTGTGYGASRIVSVAWNSAGDIAAGGWINQAWVKDSSIVKPTFGVFGVNHDGGSVSIPQADGDVYGVRFVPGTDTLLIGATQLTAVDARKGTQLWKNAINGAQAFDFSADGKTGAAGGWARNAGTFSLTDGTMISSAGFEGHIGGVALLPDGSLAVAQWGKVRPLMKLAADSTKSPLFSDQYSFHAIAWSTLWNGLVAGEEDGQLWVIGADGQPIAHLDDAGTMTRQITTTADGVLVSRGSRVVQRITAQ